MDDATFLTDRFEAERPHLRAVAYRMLGSLGDADDAVQEAWLRLSRTDATEIENLGGWLTTVVARISLNMLRSRATRREEPLGDRLPDPVVLREGSEPDPADEALLGDAVGLALLVVLDTLAPAERLAFVLHDVFAMPFDEIAPMVDRSPEATRQLASRARRRVQGAAADVEAEADGGGRRAVVDAFLAAARGGDLAGLVAVLDPDVVLRADHGHGRPLEIVRGAERVAAQAAAFRGPVESVEAVLVNGEPGILARFGGRAVSVLAFTVRGGRIAAISIIADPERLETLGM